MQTYTGRPFRFDSPVDLELAIKDVAVPLARLPRFGGHTNKTLSVAEHSCAVAHILNGWYARPLVCLHGLMHDAHEAFTGDIVAPLKRFMKDVHLFDISELQAELQCNIMAALGIPMLSKLEEIELIHKADIVACKIERDLYMESSYEWDIDDIKYDKTLCVLYRQGNNSSVEANTKDFIRTFRQFKGE